MDARHTQVILECSNTILEKIFSKIEQLSPVFEHRFYQLFVFVDKITQVFSTESTI